MKPMAFDGEFAATMRLKAFDGAFAATTKLKAFDGEFGSTYLSGYVALRRYIIFTLPFEMR